MIVKESQNMTDKHLLEAWKEAWNADSGMNPLSYKINKKLLEKGVSIFDINTRLGLIAAKKSSERTGYEHELYKFYQMAKLVSENALVDKCTEHTQGCMFILETRYGYRKGTDINITGGDAQEKKTVTWGSAVDGALSSGDGDGSEPEG